MDQRTRLGLDVLAAALGLGLLGAWLLRAAPWGLNAALWISALGLTCYLLMRRWPSARLARWLLLPVGAVALLYAGRDAGLLKLVNALAVLATLAFGIRQAQAARQPQRVCPDPDPPGLLATGVRALLDVPRFLVRGIDWRSLPAEGRGRQVVAVGRGVLLAAPVLLVFGALLASADALFETLVGHLLDVNVARWPGHLLWTVVLAWGVGGFLIGVLVHLSPDATDDGLARPRRVTLGATEMAVVLGLINGLFAAFVLVQATYFFGGHQTVLHTAGLTMAAYARRGFFELVMVAALALPFLLGVRRLLADKTGRTLRLFHGLAGLQVGLLFLMLASAAQRMWLYQQLYGLTELRLYVGAFLVWLAVVLGWFLLSVLRDHAERFVPGAAVAGLVLVATLHALNPDALIVRNHLSRAAAGQTFDALYVAHLSADAVPALLDGLPMLPPEEQAHVAAVLLARWQDAPPGWRSWNGAQAVARRAVARRAFTLRHLAERTPPHPPAEPEARPAGRAAS